MKYSQDTLKEMASTALYAYHSGDERASMLVGFLCQLTGMQPKQVLWYIYDLADTPQHQRIF